MLKRFNYPQFQAAMYTLDVRGVAVIKDQICKLILIFVILNKGRKKNVQQQPVGRIPLADIFRTCCLGEFIFKQKNCSFVQYR